MQYKLNNENAAMLLMWWMGSTDGNVDYKEDQTVNDMLDELPFEPYDYYTETKMHLSGLKNENLNVLIDRSIKWGAEHYSQKTKRQILNMLERIVESQHEITEKDRAKLKRISEGFEQ
ncbi:MAG TPA: hypothetical protein VK106_05495 [Balneolaceae bacterium]|nr:hypothetical protein [Balneolaceae bacterium]